MGGGVMVLGGGKVVVQCCSRYCTVRIEWCCCEHRGQGLQPVLVPPT